MKTLFKIGVAALAASVLAGCASVTYSTPERLNNVSFRGLDGRKVGQAVLIDTRGYNLFWTIPLVSGDLRWNNEMKSIEGGTSFFTDQVGFTELQTALLKIAETRNCDLAEVSFFDSDDSYGSITSCYFIGACLGSSHMSVSAVLVPRTDADKGGNQ